MKQEDIEWYLYVAGVYLRIVIAVGVVAVFCMQLHKAIDKLIGG